MEVEIRSEGLKERAARFLEGFGRDLQKLGWVQCSCGTWTTDESGKCRKCAARAHEE